MKDFDDGQLVVTPSGCIGIARGYARTGSVKVFLSADAKRPAYFKKEVLRIYEPKAVDIVNAALKKIGETKPPFDFATKPATIGVDWAKGHDPVNHPAHYTQGGIECIDAIRAALTPEEFRGFCKGNLIKYAWRERYKGGDESLKKGVFYINQLTEPRK